MLFKTSDEGHSAYLFHDNAYMSSILEIFTELQSH